jgi:hypothetical protein
MKSTKGPGAAGAALRAPEIDDLAGRVFSESNRLEDIDQVPIHATLIGSDHCGVDGIVACGQAPVLSLCRALIAAGYDQHRPLHAHRGVTLTLVIRSIGEGALLTVEDDRHGRPRLRRWRTRSTGCGATSPIKETASEGVHFGTVNGGML